MNEFGSLLIPIGLLVLMYFFLIRPQKKQEKQIADMRNNLHIGDEICTNGGLIGRIVKIKDEIITLEMGSDKTKLKIFKWAVREVVVPVDAPEEEWERSYRKIRLKPHGSSIWTAHFLRIKMTITGILILNIKEMWKFGQNSDTTIDKKRL